MRKGWPWVVGSACGLLAAGAAGQTASFKCAPPGTAVEYSNGSRTTWEGQQGTVCQLRQVQTDGRNVEVNWYAPAAALPANTTQAWADQVKPSTLWPLSVGKKISARYDGPGDNPGFSGSWTFTITVEKYERLMTKAGPFDAFLVVNQSEQIGRSFKTIRRQWYAPDPGVTIKFETITNGTLQSSGEAASIRR